MSELLKRCCACGEEKPLEAFHRRSAARDGRQPRCKPCAIALVVRWQAENPQRHQAKQRRSDLKRWYGLSEADHAELMNRQAGRCAICGVEAELKVDHCHSTGKVRGLLCHLCNAALGMFKDDVERLSRAADYLDRQ